MENKNVKLVHITDTHIRKSYQGDAMELIFTKGIEPAKKLEAMLHKAVRDKADCLILSGDIVHEGGAEDYAYVREMIKEVIGDKLKVIYVCGNHDRKAAMKEGLELKLDTEAIYYMTYIKEYRIIVLDSAIEGKESGCISKEQEKWLAETLRDNYGKGTILTFHHPVIWDMPQLGMKLSPACEDIICSSDVIGIFCGHTHSNNIQSWHNKVQFTADAAAFGMDLWNGRIAFTETAGMNVYYVKDGSVSAHVESLDLEPTILADFDMEAMLKFME